MRQESDKTHAAFKRLPFTFCALSLQPFATPVCTPDGMIFDHENILRWLITHDTHPVTGGSLKQSDLIKLHFLKNEAGEYVDPVTFKTLTDNSHIVAVRHGDLAHVFSYDTVERLNIKAKMWRDLLSEEEFTRKDIITLQDPLNLESRNLSSFKYLKDGEDTGVKKEEASVNTDAMGSSAKILRAKEAVQKARAERAAGTTAAAGKAGSAARPSSVKSTASTPTAQQQAKAVPYNASYHTTGLAAASLTSTGMTPHTSGALALLSEEEYLLKRGRVKQSGFVRLSTTHGDLNIELLPEHAPKAVWNFIRLSQKGFYDGVVSHRNIRNFMLQTGDPSGTGRGGSSIWGKNFEDEFEGPLKHNSRGIVSMANKGKNTNSSQFFITYREARHLDRKHTIFGRVLEDSLGTLQKLEDVPVDSSDRPIEEIKIIEVVVYVDPFADFWEKKQESENTQKTKAAKKQGDDANTTWTGKRLRQDGKFGSEDSNSVGKYLRTMPSDHAALPGESAEMVETFDAHEPVKKKARAGAARSGGGGGFGGFGSFDGW